MPRTRQQLHSAVKAEKGLAEFVPFGSETAPGVVKLKNNNGFLTTFEIEGVPFETSGEDTINEYCQALHTLVAGLSGGAYAIWTHKAHMRTHEALQDEFTNDFSIKLAAQYAQRLANIKQMRTTLYLTVVYRPGELATFKKVQMGSLAQLAAFERAAIDQLSDVAARVSSTLKAFKPRRLMRFERPSATGQLIEYSELLSFLHFTVNGFWLDIPVTHRRIANYLCTSRITAGDRSGVLQINMRDQVRFASALEISEYPKTVTPLSLSGTLYLSQEYIETQSFSVLQNRTAVERLRKQRGQLTAGGEASESEIGEFDSLFDEIQSGSLVLGEYHYSITVFSSSLGAMRQDRADVRAAIEDGGFKADVQTVAPEAAWFYQAPGNWGYRTRDALLTSRNFVALSPLHNFMAGKKTGNPWGEALCVLDSPSGQPFFFNFHCSPPDHDNTDDKLPANTCIFGKTGVGKTTLEMFLLAHLDKYATRIFVLDMDRSTEITLRRMGGMYKSFLRGQPTGINPFQWADTPRTRALCRAVAALCMTEGRSALTTDEDNRLSMAVDTVFSMPREHRRLSMLAQNLPATTDNSLQARLKRWTGDGDLAWVLDNPIDTLGIESARIWGFDYSEFIDDKQICPVFTMCLLHIFEELTDGKPIALFMEEFWKPLENPVFSKFVKDKLKTIRKEQGFVVLTTQQPDDVLSNELAKTAVQQHVTGIFLPNPKAAYEDYKAFGLTPDEYELVRNLPVDSRAFLVKQEGRSAVVRLDLSGMQEVIFVLSGDQETCEMLDEIRAVHGDDPSVWEPIFLAQTAKKRDDRRNAAAKPVAATTTLLEARL